MLKKIQICPVSGVQEIGGGFFWYTILVFFIIYVNMN